VRGVIAGAKPARRARADAHSVVGPGGGPRFWHTFRAEPATQAAIFHPKLAPNAPRTRPNFGQLPQPHHLLFRVAPPGLTRPASVGRTGALDGDIAQLGERVNGIHEVRGSIPLISTRQRR
jgi:hypothetical protein